VAGFPIQVHPLFFLTALGTGATGGWDPARLAVWFGVVFASVLVHELGHALAFRRFGHGASISLHGLGGTATSTGGRALTHRQDLWVSLAGPGAGFLLGGLVLGLQLLTPVEQAGGLVRYAVWSLLWVNFGYGLLNLLPIHPLDGGHAMAAVIRERGGNRYEWLIHGISLGAAVLGLVLSIVWRELWLGMFALVLAVMNAGRFAQTWIERGYMLGIRAASKRMRSSSEKHEAAASIEGFLAQLRPSSPPPLPPPPEPPSPPPVRREAPAVRREAPAERAPSVDQDLPEFPPDPRFLGEWLLDNGLAELALPPLRTAFAADPSPQTGHSLATALLEAGRHAEMARLLSSPSAAHLGDETLTLIATRCEAAGQHPIATRARELRQRRASARTPRA
jgi:Zn-dependent protease